MRNLPIDISDTEIQPWHSLGGIEHICELRKSCMVLYGIFTEILRMTYHDKDGRLIGTPDVTWSPNGRGLWIDSELRWEDQHPEVRPAIYVKLGQIQYAPYTPERNANVEKANRFGTRHYEHKASGQVTFMHVASTAGEACSLADNTDYALTMMQDPICHDFCFDSFRSAGRTAIQKIQPETEEKFASGVTFAFDFTEAWDVTMESPILKSIDIINNGDNIDSDSRQATVNRDNIFTEHRKPAKNG